MKREQHHLAGQTVILHLKDANEPDGIDGAEFKVEDWVENVAGQSWMFCDSNIAAMKYGIRSGMAGLPTDNEVVYGTVGAMGHIIHASELGEQVQ